MSDDSFSIPFLIFLLFFSGILVTAFNMHDINRTETIELCIKNNIPLDKCK